MPIRSLDGVTPNIHPTAFISEMAYVVGNVKIGEGSSVWPGAVVRGDMGTVIIGKNTNIQDNSVIHSDANIEIGDNVWLSFALSGGCYIQAINGIEVGDGTLFAPGVKIISANHNLEDTSTHQDGLPIRIGKRCWIGTNAVILPGVELGDDVVVAAGAVVTQSFPSRAIVAGVPARLMRRH